jgi:Predicted methyltransferase regulatory domain
MPGSSGVVPLQELLRLHAERREDKETILERLADAIAFAGSLRDAGAKYFASTPSAADRLDDMKRRNPVYLAHEYLGHWKPTSFAELASHLAKAGLRFVASANLMHHFPALEVTPAGASLLASIADPVLREMAFDVLRNQQFRDDIFIKGGAPISPSERRRILSDTAFTLVVSVAALPSSVESGNGEISLARAPLDEIIPALAADGYRAKSADEIARLCSRHPGSTDEVMNALLMLVGCRLVHPVQEHVVIDQARTGCEQLNRSIHDLSRHGRRISVVASPMTGSGIPMSPEQQLCLLAYQAGARGPDALACDACSMIADAADGGRRRLSIMKAALLFHESLPMYAALGVLPQ